LSKATCEDSLPVPKKGVKPHMGSAYGVGPLQVAVPIHNQHWNDFETSLNRAFLTAKQQINHRFENANPMAVELMIS